MDAMIGKKLDGRYELHNLIGVGGMANVYRAKDLLNDNYVAVKILREEFMQNEELVRRFKNESRAISLLNHPNIVKVYDVSVSDKIQYIVMELVDGINLKEYIDRRKDKLTWKEALHFTTQILLALQHAHDKGIVHRDIKPQNIMLLQDGTIKVMDFGIARFSRSGMHTMTDKAMGSVHYISPEQAKGDVTDKRADIYSVGVMLYEMITGRLPFDSDSAVSVAIKQISDEPTPPSQIKSDIPEGLEDITLKAMQKDPSQRYQSADEMLCAIEEFKKNPSIVFEYKYIQDDSPTRYIDKVVSSQNNNKKRTQSGAAQTGKKRSSSQPTGAKKTGYALPIMAGMAVAFAIGAIVLVFMIFKFSGNPLFNDVPTVELPNFVGMTREQIESNEAYSKFNITFNEVYRDDVAVGEIYDQSPKPPKTVKENASITLKVSIGVQEVTVPDVLKYTKEDAESALTALGLNVMMVRQPDTTVPKGAVFRTDPAAGTTMAAGQKIIVYIAGDVVNTDVEVPNIVGMDVASNDVTRLLGERQLVLGTISKAESAEPAGKILMQDPVDGERVSPGTRVNVVVSMGVQYKTAKVVLKLGPGVPEGTQFTLKCNDSDLAVYVRTNNPGGDVFTFEAKGSTADPDQIFTFVPSGDGSVYKTKSITVMWVTMTSGSEYTVEYTETPPAPPVSSSTVSSSVPAPSSSETPTDPSASASTESATA